MARSLRVYRADVDGVHEWIVAAPNQRAALDAFGVHQDLFAQGRATVEDDPARIEAARAVPGVPLRRPKGSSGPFLADGQDAGGAWAAALAAAPARPAGKDAPDQKGGRKKGAPPRPPAETAPAQSAPPMPTPRKGPSAADRLALRGAEAQLRAFEREAVKETAALEAEQAELDRRKRRLERDQARRREQLQRNIDRARAVVER
ncbi:MAG: hypothetical protein K1X35_02400 [Caulobacteraceae bacterium]|nr:hypothetical protein [Caulobacteraceae bacterium]